MLAKTRQQAIREGSLYYDTREPCKHGHLSKRNVRNWGCYECGQIATKRWNKKDREADPEKYREKSFQWAEANRERTREQARRWRRDNPDKAKAIEQRPERKAAKVKRVKENLPYYAAATAKRRAALKSATPAWANEAKIKNIYKLAAWASKYTNEPLEVDHIIPLQGHDVCGLHVETNMQILPKSENIRKFNHWRD